MHCARAPPSTEYLRAARQLSGVCSYTEAGYLAVLEDSVGRDPAPAVLELIHGWSSRD